MEFKRKMELIDLKIKKELKKKRNKIKRGIGVGSKGVYLRGAVCGDGKTEREVCRRVQAGANAWRAVEGVMADRRISKRLKGMSTCVTPACLYGTETLALTELQQQRRQECEEWWI